MKKSIRKSGFALTVTLVLMVLIVIVVVAYLVSTRIERSTSNVYANRLRAKMQADSALAAAIHLLKENTRYGNYITAMPAPVPTPASIYTEIYRPTDRASRATLSDDYLRFDNAGGEILVSLASSGSSAGPDPRPMPAMVYGSPTPTPLPPFAVPSPAPALSSTNSYDFNQIVTTGSTTARLVQPSPSPAPPPAYGEWVNVRDANSQLVGRYAFFIEDESMKVNLNVAGNASPTPRPGDLAIGSFPVSQVQEIDPSGILPAASRAAAYSTLITAGPSGGRLNSKGTAAVIDSTNWKTNFPLYAHIATVLSRDEVTTARGWQRLDLNNIVAANDPQTAAQKIANWIRDAWTGSTSLSNLQSFQMFNDDRLRLQIAANIVDYIDADDVPTDMGDVNGYPVIGIEKIPYLTELDISYKSTVTNPGAPNVPNSGAARITVNIRVNFQNLYDQDLPIENQIRNIRIHGIPAVDKNGSVILDSSDCYYDIPVGSGPSPEPSPSPCAKASAITGIVPWGGDNVSGGTAGVTSFTTGTILTQNVTYTPSDPTSSSTGVISQFESGLLDVQVTGANNKRIDVTKISLPSRLAKRDNASASPQLQHDFLENSDTASSINVHYGRFPSGAALAFGDPRYRPEPIASRWYTVTRTDSARLATTQNLSELECRAYAVDWYDYSGNRPLAFYRNGPMLSVGELGNVAVCEYPWRTLYLQYAGRPESTTDPDIMPFIQDRRGSSAAAQTNPALLPQDYVLVDLFKTSAQDTRDGAININTQFNVPASPTPAPTATPNIDQGALTGLLASLPVGGGVPSPSPTAGSTPTVLTSTATTTIATIIAGRRNAVTPLATGGPGSPGGSPPIDNNHRCPYFTIGQLASDISWLINQSTNATQSVSGRTHTKVLYSVLRANPLTASQFNRNYGSDMQVEEPFRKISNAITTRGNVFRVLYVGQSLKNGLVQAEYLGEAFVERQASFAAGGSNPDAQVTSDSSYKLLANRVITE